MGSVGEGSEGYYRLLHFERFPWPSFRPIKLFWRCRKPARARPRPSAARTVAASSLQVGDTLMPGDRLVAAPTPFARRSKTKRYRA